MSESGTFSQEYRNNLAKDIRMIPQVEKTVRKEKIAEARETFDYKLAAGEKIAKQNGFTHISPQIKEQELLQGEGVSEYEEHFMSNEAHLYKLFPVIREKTGAIIATGSDTLHDLYANSKSKLAFSVDISEKTPLLTRTLLEVGVYHKKIFGKYPTPEEYKEYFDPQNIHHVKRIMSNVFTPEDVEKVMPLFSEPARGTASDEKKLYYSTYLDYKSNAKDNDGNPFSWCSTPEKLTRVLQGYEEGEIIIIRGDLNNPQIFSNVAGVIASRGTSADVIYLSDAERKKEIKNEYFKLAKNINSLPFNENTVILRTSHAIQEQVRIEPPAPLNQLFQPWLYIAQKLTDWQQKLKNDNNYGDAGWIKDVEAGLAARLEYGVALVGFNAQEIQSFTQKSK